MNLRPSYWLSPLRSYVALCTVLLGLCLPSTKGQTPLDNRLRGLDFEQKLGQSISLDNQFVDERGATVSLSTLLDGKPAVLVPGYYGCPMLCRAVSNALVGALRDLPLTAGRDFSVIQFTINPEEGPALAAAKKASYLKAYGRPGSDVGWHLLTSAAPASQRLAGEIGFHYIYDQDSRQYAHPSGIVILTPKGVISHYCYGVNFTASELAQALDRASREGVGDMVRRLFLLCFHYQPITGKAGIIAMNVLRGLAVVLLFALFAWIVVALRAERIKPVEPSR